MAGQMCWFPCLGAESEKILYLRRSPDKPWQPYTSCPEYSVPDYKIDGGSKGWATYQKLHKAGWQLISTAQAQRTNLAISISSGMNSRSPSN